MKEDACVDRLLGTSSRLITPADREWLVQESKLIEEVSRRLADVEKGPLDFAAGYPPLPRPE